MALDLDARFAGVDVKLAEIREVLGLHTTRFTRLETRLSDMDARLAAIDTKLDRVLAAIAGKP